MYEDDGKYRFKLVADVKNNSIELWMYGVSWGGYKICRNRPCIVAGCIVENALVFSFHNVKKDILDEPRGVISNIVFNDKTGVLYIIKAAEFYKIGITTDPLCRVKTIGTKLPIKCRIIRTYFIPKNDLRNIESFWHDFFSAKNSNGEWFFLSNNDLAIIDYSMAMNVKPSNTFNAKQLPDIHSDLEKLKNKCDTYT